MKKYFKGCTAYPWYEEGGYSFRGYIYDNGIVLERQKAITWLKEQRNHKPIDQILHDIHGAFCLIVEEDKQVTFAVDRIRSFPIFYTVVDGELYLGDDSNAIVAAMPKVEIDPVSEEEYRNTSLFVTGKETIIQNLYQVRTFTFCKFDMESKAVQEQVYYTLSHKNLITDESELRSYAQETYRKLAKHMVAVLNGRTAVVPLSGGADSRLLLSMLRQENYEKVLCFTYGPKGQREAEISKAVAAHFGYPWMKVIYDKKFMRQFRNSELLHAYEEYAFCFTSTPHIQDFPAVWYLKEHGLLPEDSVFLPGHTIIDDLNSVFLQKEVDFSDAMDVLIDHFFSRYPTGAVYEKLLAQLNSGNLRDSEEWAAKIEQYNAQERQTKYIQHSVRVYEFFGYSWLTTMWDKSVYDLNDKIPNHLRHGRKLYLSLVDHTVTSTNEKNNLKKFADRFRKKGLLRTVLRRGIRVARYFKSQTNFEQIFPTWQYLKGCLTDVETFKSHTLLCYRQIDRTKELCKKHHG